MLKATTHMPNESPQESLCFDASSSAFRTGTISYPQHIKNCISHFAGARHPPSPDCSVDNVVHTCPKPQSGDSFTLAVYKAAQQPYIGYTPLTTTECHELSDIYALVISGVFYEETIIDLVVQLRNRCPDGPDFVTPLGILAVREGKWEVVRWCRRAGAILDNSSSWDSHVA
jgi:hypothetical protein